MTNQNTDYIHGCFTNINHTSLNDNVESHKILLRFHNFITLFQL